MAIVKGMVTIEEADGKAPVGRGRCYLHVPTVSPNVRGDYRGGAAPKEIGGTIADLIWEGSQPVLGSRYRLTFEDGQTLEVALTKCTVTSCGPQILRFTATSPLGEQGK